MFLWIWTRVRQDIFRLRLAAKADALNGTAADEGAHERLERFRHALTLLEFLPPAQDCSSASCLPWVAAVGWQHKL